MSFGQLLSILRARWAIGVTIFAITVVVTTVITLLLPKQYTGTASVVVDIKPDPVSAMAFPTAALPGFMATQVDILTSDRVALKVIRDLKLLENPQLREQWQESTDGQGSIEQWLADSLQKKLDVKPSRESNVIAITYKAPDPRFAAALANAFAQAYIATTLELRVDPAKQYATFFDVRAKDAREAVERAQTKLSEFQREKGIIATDERLDVENARLNELSTQLVQIEAIATESTSRQSQAQGATGDRMQEVLNNQVVAAMRVDLARNEARLQELSAKYGDNHPQVQETKANIAELRGKLDAEVRRVTGGVAVSNTINRQREAQLRKDLDQQRAKVLRLKAVRDEGQVLAREAENAQRAYDAVMGRLTQTSLESQTTQSYVTMLSSAAPPVDPASPRVALNIALSMVIGIVLGVAAALLLELLDRRVRAADDLSAALGLPVIGYMPRPDAKRLARARVSLMQQQVIGLPAPTRGA
ncbi:MAG: chain length determinant protein EpsF [Burkholderiales bacterium]